MNKRKAASLEPKRRKSRGLSEDDLAHYQKIVVASHEVVRLMEDIDEVIDENGGWPAAFQTGSGFRAVTGEELPMATAPNVSHRGVGSEPVPNN
jgi:hypothetical protein